VTEAEREELLILLKPVFDVVSVNDSDSLARCTEDSYVIFHASGSWTPSAKLTLGDLRKICDYFPDKPPGPHYG
jgi:hypothetical protein